MTVTIIMSSMTLLAVGCALGFFLAMRFTKKALRSATHVLRGFEARNFKQRAVVPRSPHLAILLRTLNETAEHLNRHFLSANQEKTRLSRILMSIVEGVLVTDENGVIEFVNPAFSTIFCVEGRCEGKKILECVRIPEVQAVIVSALTQVAPYKQLISFTQGASEKHILAHATPLQGIEEVRGVVVVFSDVTELKKLEVARKEFVANVSHELKTPLTNILGYAETLKGGALQQAKDAKRFLDRIEQNAYRLKSVVEGLLDLAAVEAGRFRLDLKPLALHPFMEEVCAEFDDRCRERGIHLTTAVPVEALVMADASALQRIFSNLLDNAMRYTPHGGSIDVSAKQSGDQWEIAIADTGSGIPADDLPHIFERFYRVDKSHSRDTGGTGLGLAIVKHLVHAMGGEIHAQSEVGQGTVVTLHFS
ncbi:MAG: PAS domain-containing protein [Deltaproteobacteria bacterium]|nr:PAS domain-containing protein [Deltaproteobacteria bacterium]